jgi:hypothetical protein
MNKSSVLTTMLLLAFYWANPTQAATHNFQQRIYQDLKLDYLAQEYYHSNLNLFRDGVPSSYIKEDYNNALPLLTSDIERLPTNDFISYPVFAKAMLGFEKIKNARRLSDETLLTIVDFDIHSRQRRFFVLDIERSKVLFSTWTSHASKSDPENKGIPTIFSNVSKSNTSSVGFMLSSNSYYGQWGYSMRLIGLDTKLNSSVLSRAVVIHQSGAMDLQTVRWGNPATSMGCLMLPYYDSGRFYAMEDKPINELVIDTFKQQPSVIFVHTSAIDVNTNRPYLDQSDWLQEN